MGNHNLVPYETIVRVTSGEPEAVGEVYRISLWRNDGRRERLRLPVQDAP